MFIDYTFINQKLKDTCKKTEELKDEPCRAVLVQVAQSTGPQPSHPRHLTPPPSHI